VAVDCANNDVRRSSCGGIISVSRGKLHGRSPVGLTKCQQVAAMADTTMSRFSHRSSAAACRETMRAGRGRGRDPELSHSNLTSSGKCAIIASVVRRGTLSLCVARHLIVHNPIKAAPTANDAGREEGVGGCVRCRNRDVASRRTRLSDAIPADRKR
jgi:hypothetical protein